MFVVFLTVGLFLILGIQIFQIYFTVRHGRITCEEIDALDADYSLNKKMAHARLSELERKVKMMEERMKDDDQSGCAERTGENP